MRKTAVIFIVLIVTFAVACTYTTENPLEFPTPPPAPGATPLAKLELKRDAELEDQIAKIAAKAKGKVGVAAVMLETGEAAVLSADDRYPMQSVYKLPISMAVMEQVRLEKLDLDEKIGVTKEDFVRAGMRSPLRDENPNGGEFTIRELIRQSMVESDGTASDVLMRVADGATQIQTYLTQIGIRGVRVANTEKEIGGNWLTQYDNYATPVDAVELLRWLHTAGLPNRDDIDRGIERAEYQTLLKFMADSNPGAKRLKGSLPSGTVVAHKTGTSGTQNGITAATNDVGIIHLPNGKHIAISVFVSDTPADEKTREVVIAKIAKACWDRWSR